jgi:hypothetical protein
VTLLNFVFQGANFRDLTGVMVGANNIVEFDPKIKRVYLKSGKPLVSVLPNTSNDVSMVVHDFLSHVTICCYISDNRTSESSMKNKQTMLHLLCSLTFYYSIKVFVL